MILDNYATHETHAVERWRRRHARVHFHFPPTPASWLNLVDTLFNGPSRRLLHRLAVHSVAEPLTDITSYFDRRNEDPTPFAWTAFVRSICAKGSKAKDTFASRD